MPFSLHSSDSTLYLHIIAQLYFKFYSLRFESRIKVYTVRTSPINSIQIMFNTEHSDCSSWSKGILIPSQLSINVRSIAKHRWLPLYQGGVRQSRVDYELEPISILESKSNFF